MVGWDSWPGGGGGCCCCCCCCSCWGGGGILLLGPGETGTDLVSKKQKKNFSLIGNTSALLQVITSIIAAWAVVTVAFGFRNLIALLRIIERRVACLMVTRRRWWWGLGRTGHLRIFHWIGATSSYGSSGIVMIIRSLAIRMSVLRSILVFFSWKGHGIEIIRLMTICEVAGFYRSSLDRRILDHNRGNLHLIVRKGCSGDIDPPGSD